MANAFVSYWTWHKEVAWNNIDRRAFLQMANELSGLHRW